MGVSEGVEFNWREEGAVSKGGEAPLEKGEGGISEGVGLNWSSRGGVSGRVGGCFKGGGAELGPPPMIPRDSGAHIVANIVLLATVASP